MQPKTIFLMLMLLPVINASQAQQQKSLAIRFLDGTENNTAISSLQKITFSDNNMLLNNNDGTTTTFAISTINKLYFSTLTSNEYITPENNSLFIYPNPASGFIYIKNIPEEETIISVYRIDGTLALQTKITQGSRQLDLSNLKNGLYIIKVNNQALKFRKK